MLSKALEWCVIAVVGVIELIVLMAFIATILVWTDILGSMIQWP